VTLDQALCLHGQGLEVGVVTVAGVVLHQGQGQLVGDHLAVHVGAVELALGRVDQVGQLLGLVGVGVGHLAGLGQVVLVQHGQQLGGGVGVHPAHHRAELAHVHVLALLLGQLPGVAFEGVGGGGLGDEVAGLRAGGLRVCAGAGQDGHGQGGKKQEAAHDVTL